MRVRAFFLAVTCSTTFTFAEPPRQSLQAIESGEGVEIRDGRQPILFFRTSPRSLNGAFTRASYVHPLYDLDGRVLTEDFPEDHKHHRGIFWAWHQLLVGDVHAGDPWVCRDFLTHVEGVAVKESATESVAITSNAVWKSPLVVDDDGNEQPIVRETASIRVWQVDESCRRIDFEIRLLALLPDVRIGGSDDTKGYGGFSPRLRIPPDVQFLAEYGVVEPQRQSVDPSPWMSITTEADSHSRPTGITILTHPTTPGFPQRWILRRARSMQNAVYPGRTPVPLSPKVPLTLRYRVIIHRGEVDVNRVTQWQKEYSDSKPSR